MSLPQVAASRMGTLTSVPLPLLSVLRQRHRLFLLSSTSTSGPPVTSSFGSATFVPDSRWPAFAIGEAVFFARSMRQTVLFAVSRTYGAPSEPRTRLVKDTGLSGGEEKTSFDLTYTTPYRRAGAPGTLPRRGGGSPPRGAGPP